MDLFIVVGLVNLMFIVGVIVFKKLWVKVVFYMGHIGYLLYWYIDSRGVEDGWALIAYAIIFNIIAIMLFTNTIILIVFIVKNIKQKKTKVLYK